MVKLDFESSQETMPWSQRIGWLFGLLFSLAMWAWLWLILM